MSTTSSGNLTVDEISAISTQVAGVSSLISTIFPQAAIVTLAAKGLAVLAPAVYAEIEALFAKGNPTADELAAFIERVNMLDNIQALYDAVPPAV